MKMPSEIRSRCFELRCQAKRGLKLNRKDQQFVTQCFEKYPEDYSAMGNEVFIATHPNPMV